MKEHIKFIAFCLLVIFCISCEEKVESTNSPDGLRLSFYADGEPLILENDIIENYFKEVTLKVIPKNTDFQILESSYYYEDTADTFFQLPLMQNDGNPLTLLNPEEFRFIITHKETEVFNEELQVHYIQYGEPFLSVYKTNRKNEEGEWELLQRHKIPITDEDGQETAYEFEVELASRNFRNN